MILSAKRSAIFAAAMIGLWTSLTECHAEASAPEPSVVRQIDHILISSAQATELFTLLSETFELPVAWPMSNFGAFASGGVALGNVNVEVLRSSQSATGVTNSRFVGLALEPEPLGINVKKLDARRIPHGAPAPFKSRRLFGPSTVLWTTLALPSVSSDAVEVFFCEYGHDVPARRQRLREQLQSRNGGPLSVQSVREVVYGATDLERSKAHWQRLLDPLQPSSTGKWQIGAGPAIHMVLADRDEIQQLTIAVGSLEHARRFLKEHGLLRMDGADELTLGGAPLGGLSIKLVEQR